MVKFLKEHVIIHFNNNSYKGDTMLKVFKVALLGALVATASLNADDFLSKATGGTLSDVDFGVKKLDAADMSNIQGGYRVSNKIYELINMNSGSTSLIQIGKLVTLSPEEIASKKLGYYQNDSAGSGYWAEQRYREAVSVADPSKDEYLMITATKVTRTGAFGVPIPTFSQGAIVLGIANGAAYKLRNADLSSYIASDAMRYEKNNLNRALVVNYR